MKHLLKDKLFTGILHLLIFILLINLSRYVHSWIAILIPVYLIYILYFTELKFRFFTIEERTRYMFGIIFICIVEIVRLYYINN